MKTITQSKPIWFLHWARSS